MSKFGQRLIKAAREAQTIARRQAEPKSYRVHVPADVDAPAIRAKLGLSQAELARRFGIPQATLKDWEQGRRKPEGPARVLLLVIKSQPKAVEKALEHDISQKPLAGDTVPKHP
jgi:putative transcriptional regulator